MPIVPGIPVQRDHWPGLSGPTRAHTLRGIGVNADGTAAKGNKVGTVFKSKLHKGPWYGIYIYGPVFKKNALSQSGWQGLERRDHRHYM